MLIVVGSIQQETNTFSFQSATIADFDISRGEAMLSRIAVTDYFRSESIEIVPTLYANNVPSGRLALSSFQLLLEDMIERFPTGRKIDGVWLYCHGAMEVENIGSGDVAILSAVRAKVGLDVPIALALDFHANNSTDIAKYANIVCGYKTAPHSDITQTQLRAAKHLVWCIRNSTMPQVAIVQVPLMLTGDMVITAAEPMRSIIKETEHLEEEEGILTASVFNGQPWVDAVNTGTSALVVAKSHNYMEKAREHASRLAKMLWEARKKYSFQVEAMEPEAAIEAALQQENGPVFISDSGDNTTAGAPGNNAYLLNRLMDAPLDGVLLAGLTDPDAVATCKGMISGQSIEISLGGTLDRNAEQAHVQAVFKHKCSVLGWGGEDAGVAVVLSVPGMDMIITARRCAFISPEIIESAGVRLEDYRVIVVKLGYLYPLLDVIAKNAYLALTPGVSCEAIERLAFTNIRRPMYPMDTDFNWSPYDD